MIADSPSRILALAEEALADAANSDVETSVVLDKAIRLARMREDAHELVWLTMETRAAHNEVARKRIAAELRPYFSSPDEIRRLWTDAVEEWIAERSSDVASTDEHQPILALSVRELEARMEGLRELAYNAPPDAAAARSEALHARANVREMLARIRHRIQDYLARVEAEIVVGAMVSTVFEEQRRFVDERFRTMAPDAFEQLASAYRRRAEGDTESRSQALNSCRRALKSVADAVYPARSGTVAGADGVSRRMTEDKYISRLLQFAYEASGSNTSGVLLQAQIEELAAKLEALNDLVSKGVHAATSEFESNQAIIQTYLTLGEILRMADM